ncbi:hypothetical protein SY83_07155 [Paenibacillus swuensis]|uniref:Glycosyl transferase family 1 domain-containing protein n=1 Tax=Paenibacillus swuensis TaxID=1178515 RepID=A0A172TGU3_9BACL|nr:glycosyltransferase family 4 protein [Paenibacillus swuensis]ANE46097.1 hypothetical protein SY83_07155 [Paenibacillus swuensis]
MKILFTYFVPSGGMETLNRLRCEALQERGVVCQILYTMSGAGTQNNRGTPIHVTNQDAAIHALIMTEGYDAVFVGSDFEMLARLRRLGYRGPLVYEAQGLGSMEQAELSLHQGAEYIRSCCDAVLYPTTPHLIHLFQSMFPTVKHFCFTNLLDTSRFTYRPQVPAAYPIIGWVGRIEANKNWSDFLEIGYWLLKEFPVLKLWMFEDANLYDPAELHKYNLMVDALHLLPHIVRRSNVPHDEMADYLSMIGDSGGLVISTSKVEGFGYAVAEAMSCRCPVLSTDSDGVKIFIIPEVTGQFYPLGNIPQAVHEARTMMSSPNYRASLRDHAQTHIATTFAPSLYTDRFIAMLNTLGVY